MTSFTNAYAYSPLLVLLFGLATFTGSMGLGHLLLRLLRVNLPAPFVWIVSVLLGIQTGSLAVQVIAMAQAATPWMLISLWCSVFGVGAFELGCFCRPARAAGLPRVPWPAVATVMCAASINLMAAVVPSSKIDELYYHMLLPARIVTDQGLTLYRGPIESAILPQMSYQFFAAPLHALGYPDAPNIVSWLLGLMLAWLGWTLLRDRKIAVVTPYYLVAAIPVGAYPIVFHGTGGAHAFGDLSLATAVVVLATAESFLAASSPAAFAFTVSLLSCSAAASKASLYPISVMLLVLGGGMAWRALQANDSRARLGLILVAPWLILATPMMAWSYVQTGSPFGPLLAGLFGPSLYDPATFTEFANDSRGLSAELSSDDLFDNLASYSPLVWLAAIGALTSSAVPLAIRKWGSMLLLVQLALIAWLLPYHARFLGGLQYGLAICFAIYGSRQVASWGNAKLVMLVLCLAPWMAGQAYYGGQFARMALGIEDRGAFFRRHIAFYDDFAKLDRLLPRNAILLSTDFRAPAVYSPRPMVFDAADILPGREVYVFSSSRPDPSKLPANYALKEEVYLNVAARQSVYRRQWVAPEIGELHVTRIAQK